MKVVKEGVVEMVQWLQSRRGSVVNCARGAFDERKNVRLVLVDEGGGGIKGRSRHKKYILRQKKM